MIKSKDKKRARLTCMKHFLNSLEYPGKDYEVACAPDPLIVSTAQHVLHDALHLLGKSLYPGCHQPR